MASRRTCTRRAFTLIEVVIVMALVVLVASFGLFLSLESYRADSFRSERDTLVAALQTARSQAVNNMCFGAACTDGKPHGVHIGVHQYVLFQGESYATRDTAVDQVIDARYDGLTAVPPSFNDIVFSRLAGTTTPNPLATRTITLIDTAGPETSTITVNPEGQISWTN